MGGWESMAGYSSKTYHFILFFNYCHVCPSSPFVFFGQDESSVVAFDEEHQLITLCCKFFLSTWWLDCFSLRTVLGCIMKVCWVGGFQSGSCTVEEAILEKKMLIDTITTSWIYSLAPLFSDTGSFSVKNHLHWNTSRWNKALLHSSSIWIALTDFLNHN